MRLQKRKSDKFACWAFLMPTLIFLAVTALFPLLYSVYLSFFRLKLNMPNQVPTFVGLNNYIKMFSDTMLHTSTINTLVFAFVSVALEVVLGLMVANIFMCLLGYVGMRGFAKISSMPLQILTPMVFMFCAVGTFAFNRNVTDIFIMVAFGALNAISKDTQYGHCEG